MVEHSKLLFGLVALLGIVVAVSVLVSAWLGALTVGLPLRFPYENEVSLEVSVNDVNPLVLSVNMKSLYYADIQFDHGYIQDGNQTVVAECPRTVGFGSVSDGRGHSVPHFIVCILPANSEKTVTLNFNTTLPSGNYRLALNIYGKAFYSNYFIIP
jgi:hypothetical protein